MALSGLQQDLGAWATQMHRQKYSYGGTESWEGTAHRVATAVLGALGYSSGSEVVGEVERLIRLRKFLPGGRYLYAAGRDFHQVNNCLLMEAEDSREGWAELQYKATMSLMTGAGIGVVYSALRERDALIRRTGGRASGPVSLMHSINEGGRQYQQGGSRRSAIWAGLHWNHPDVFEFIRVKDWSEELRALKAKDHDTWMPMELTNISVILDDAFFAAYERGDDLAHQVYRATVKRMLKTGEPGFSVDTGDNAGEHLRNACTEVTSRDDSDVCNLGSINLANIESVEELRSVVQMAALFLLAGTVYSDVPYQKVANVRAKNRRLGLGVMGVHEWLLQREHPYAPNAELAEWMNEYALSTEVAASWADLHGLSRPVKTRAIAPTGTIGIIAETTTGIEPLFCAAYIRRWLEGNTWRSQYIVDPVAERLHAKGIRITDEAYMLSHDIERRLDMQVWAQTFVDHGISSTLNLPAPVTDGTEVADFGDMLIKKLPHLRGMTVYPDGARSGQPLEAVSIEEALEAHAMVAGYEDACASGVCGI